jgi:hypothetical protein
LAVAVLLDHVVVVAVEQAVTFQVQQRFQPQATL